VRKFGGVGLSKVVDTFEALPPKHSLYVCCFSGEGFSDKNRILALQFHLSSASDCGPFIAMLAASFYFCAGSPPQLQVLVFNVRRCPNTYTQPLLLSRSRPGCIAKASNSMKATTAIQNIDSCLAMRALPGRR